MLVFTKYTSTIALNVRLRDATGQYRDFTALSWVGTESADTVVACTEYTHAVGGTSLYLASISVPVNGPFVWEVFIASTGEVVNYGSTALDAPITAIPTAPLLAVDYVVPPSVTAIRQEMDTNSTRLDVAISTRATNQSIWEYTTRALTDKSGFSLNPAAILAVWNQLTADGGLVANSFGAKIKGWLLGSDNKVLISADPQDLSSTLDVNAKTVEDKVGYMLATVSVASPDLGMFGKGGAVGAAILDMTIEQGADFSRRVVYKVGGNPVDLTGYTARGQVRTKPSAATALADFTIIFENPRSTGAFLLEISSTTSSGFIVGDDVTRAENRLYYDIELVTPAAKVIRILQGRLIVSPEVTK